MNYILEIFSVIALVTVYAATIFTAIVMLYLFAFILRKLHEKLCQYYIRKYITKR